jgi:transposase InsO family protein
VSRPWRKPWQRQGKPEIFNTNQGCQFTGTDFTNVLEGRGITISMDGKRCYGASGEDKASSSLETTDGVPHAAAE